MKHYGTKTFERILYVAHQLPGIDIVNLRASLYFGDLMSVRRIGRLVADDTYLALVSGPMPLSLFVGLRENLLSDHIRVNDQLMVFPERLPRLEVFSESDLIFLGKSVDSYGKRERLYLRHCFSLDKTFSLFGQSAKSEFGLLEIAETLDRDGPLLSYVRV